MNQGYISIYLKLKQAVDVSYNAETKYEKEFFSEILALLSEMHPEKIFDIEYTEFALNLSRHFLAKWKKLSNKVDHEDLLLLIKKLGALVVKDKNEKSAGYNGDDEDALVEMNLKIIPERPGPLMWFAVAVAFSFFGNSIISNYIAPLGKPNYAIAESLGNPATDRRHTFVSARLQKE